MPETPLTGAKHFAFSTNTTNETVVFNEPVIIYGVFFPLGATGTLALVDASSTGSGNDQWIFDTSIPFPINSFPAIGVEFTNGLTMQKTVGTDLAIVLYRYKR